MKEFINPVESKNIIQYVPHAVREDVFKPVDKTQTDAFRQRYGIAPDDFVVGWSNRNIRRKLPGTLIMAYKWFVDQVPEDKRDKCVLFLNTEARDQNGTDLIAVKEAICPDYKVVINGQKLPLEDLNVMYNSFDVTVNIASNEGFGLSALEGHMAGTPSVINVTGGLQDQCGFKLNGKYLTEKDYVKIGSLNDRDIWKDRDGLTWGVWTYPVWPSNLSVEGSVPTPYIFDDRPNFKEIASGMLYWHNKTYDERKARGIKARIWAMSESGMNIETLSKRMITSLEMVLEEFDNSNKFDIWKV